MPWSSESNQTYVYIADSDDQSYQVAVDNNGNLLTPVPSDTPATTYIINPEIPNLYRQVAQISYLFLISYPSNSFQLQVQGGAVVTVPVDFNLNNPPSALILSPNGVEWWIQCQPNGQVTVARNWATNPLSASFGNQVGQLTLTDYIASWPYLPVQPAGPSTTVTDPQSLPSELTGLFASGCGHSVVGWSLQQTSVDGEPMYAVCCPYCNFNNQLLTPQQLDQIFYFGGIIT